MNKIVSIALATALTLSVAACGSAPASSPADSSTALPASATATNACATLIVGASPSPHAEILEFVKAQVEAEGCKLEIREFTDYVLPNTALADNQIDANYFQHLPYLEDFNVNNKTSLISAVGVHFEPLGLYPGKTATVDALPDGAKIAVPNDTTNEARALALLEAQGLIKLREGAGLAATPKDIIDNPKNLKIVELAAEQVPSALSEVDLAVINGNYALPAGIIDTVLAIEDSSIDAAKTFANILAIRPESKDNHSVATLVKALTSEETRRFIEGKYGVAVVPVF